MTCALALAVCVAAAPARSEPGLVVGVDDDTAKWMGRSTGPVATYEDLGLGGVRVTIPWRLGRSRPNHLIGPYLHRVAQLVARGQRVVLGV